MTYQSAIETALTRPKSRIVDPKPRSLVVQVALKMVFWASLSTLVLTTAGYVFVFERAEQRAESYLGDYLTQRVRAESHTFRASEANLAKFRSRFLALYADPKVLPTVDFDSYFQEGSDGAYRLRKRYYDGTLDEKGLPRSGTSGFIGRKRAPLTDELKRRLVITYDLISELGPAWIGPVANVHATLPENAIVVYWPGTPWGLKAKADAYFPAQPIIRDTLQSANPSRRPIWSGVYPDQVTKKWTVTYELPVDFRGKHLINPSQDVLLDDLMARLVRDHPEGAYNFIIAKNGNLIAHPDWLTKLPPERDAYVGKLGDPKLVSLYQAIRSEAAMPWAKRSARVFESDDLDAYVSFGEIQGPGWWFVTVYPRSLVQASAREAANGLLMLGFASFALMTLAVIAVLRDRVSHPIRQMKVASEHVSSGNYVAVADGAVGLPEDQDNEIGLLARSFKSMAKKVGDSARHLERIVEERTLALQAANTELERLSVQDGLTGAFNRRGFDRDLAVALYESARGDETYALVLCDVDHFKRYNDTYGHHAGDECLKAVVREISRYLPGDRVYRYGGEEVAVIMSAPDLGRCREVASGLVRAVSELGLPHRESPYGIVTISAGLVLLDSAGATSAEAISAADICLYRAKEKGRNRLEHALPEPASV